MVFINFFEVPESSVKAKIYDSFYNLFFTTWSGWLGLNFWIMLYKLIPFYHIWHRKIL